MIRACDLELMIVHLEAVLAYAEANNFDDGFVDIIHKLIKTVKENQ